MKTGILLLMMFGISGCVTDAKACWGDYCKPETVLVRPIRNEHTTIYQIVDAENGIVCYTRGDGLSCVKANTK